MSSVKQLRASALIEGLSFLVLLFIAMPLKHLAGMPTPTRIVGSLHGLFFLVFIISLVRAALEKKWAASTTFALFWTSLIPFGWLLMNRRLGDTTIAGKPPTDV